MDKIHSFSFCSDNIKYITLQRNGTSWGVVDYGKLPLEKDQGLKDRFIDKKDVGKKFKRKGLKKNRSVITLGSHECYLNMKKITTLQNLKPEEVVNYNYENILPIIFDKGRFALEYAIESYSDNTTEISFMGVPREKIDKVNRLTNELGIKVLSAKPSFQYMADCLRVYSRQRESEGYALYIDLSEDFITFVLIHKSNPILKRTVSIDKGLELNIRNYFYYLSYYLTVSNLSVYLSNTTPEVEQLLLKYISKDLKVSSTYRIYEIFAEHLSFNGSENEIYHTYQHCLLGLGRMIESESSKENSYHKKQF